MKALQNTKRILQLHSKDKDVELAASREMLAKSTKEITKLKMEKQTIQAKTPQPQSIEEDMDVEGGVPCTYCDYEARSMTELKAHYKKHHNLECKKCNQKFLHKNVLDTHREEKHNTVAKKFVCDVCQLVTKTVDQAKEHAQTHNKKNEREMLIHECPLCGFVTKDTVEVDTHMKQKHKKKVFRCAQCVEYAAGTKEDLHEHAKKHSKKDKLLSCGHCDFTVNNDNDLTAHMNTSHQYSNVSTKQCRYYRVGKCNRPTTCTYKHEGPVIIFNKTSKIGEENQAPRCTRGPECRFKEQGRCHYYHEGVRVQMQKENSQQSQSQQAHKEQTHMLWCKFQDTCKKGPKDCPFRHYNIEFPKLPTSRLGNVFN